MNLNLQNINNLKVNFHGIDYSEDLVNFIVSKFGKPKYIKKNLKLLSINIKRLHHHRHDKYSLTIGIKIIHNNYNMPQNFSFQLIGDDLYELTDLIEKKVSNLIAKCSQ